MDDDVIEVVHPEGAGEAGRVLCPGGRRGRGAGIEHRVVDDELATSVEELAQAPSPAGSLECVLLVDNLPRKVAPLQAQAVARLREFLLVRQMLLSRRHPFPVRNHLVLHGARPSRTRDMQRTVAHVTTEMQPSVAVWLRLWPSPPRS